MTAAFMYPGQGSQAPGMFSDLPDVAAVHDTLREADDLLPDGVSDLDSADSLARPLGAQLAMLVCGVAATRALADLDAFPDIVAGHSVGAFPAAVAAGALDLGEAIVVVERRARCMEALFPDGYGMLAISGLGEIQVDQIAEQATGEGKPVWLANVNSFDQMVVTGTDPALARVDELAHAAGAHRTRRISIAGPSHAPILEPVSDELRSVLADLPERTLTARYVTISDARPARDRSEVLEDLAVSVSRPVRWRDTVGVVAELGARFLLQLPPGRVLVDLARATLGTAHAATIDARAMSEQRLDDCAHRIRHASDW